MAAAGVQETREAIDAALREQGGVYGSYSCKEVSWDDVSRGTVSGQLSCWGSNITDTYLKAKDGTPLFTVRPDNWNERLGHVRADHVALLVGNCDDDSAFAPHPPPLRNVTLRDFLADAHGSGGAYSGLLAGTRLDGGEVDERVSIRFQTVFLPVADEDNACIEFASEAYNYNTTSDAHPRNLVVLCTSQGIAVQPDGKGQKRLLHHARERAAAPVSRFWLEAERSRHAVGGAQHETLAERADAHARGKATAGVLGLRAMGTRFNVLMTVQIPLVAPAREAQPPVVTFGGFPGYSKSSGTFGAQPPAMQMLHSEAFTFGAGPPALDCFPARARGRRRCVGAAAQGASYAARVSRGSYAGPFEPMRVDDVRRERKEHVTVTVVMYHTVCGGVPKVADVVGAIDDMERLYGACDEDGELADAAFEFMKKPLTVDDIGDISRKIYAQPGGAAPDEAWEKVHKTSSGSLSQDERDGVEHAIRALEEDASEHNVQKVKLVALGALEKCNATAASTVRMELDKLLALRKEPGTGRVALKNQVVMVGLLIRGAMCEKFA